MEEKDLASDFEYDQDLNQETLGIMPYNFEPEEDVSSEEELNDTSLTNQDKNEVCRTGNSDW